MYLVNEESRQQERTSLCERYNVSEEEHPKAGSCRTNSLLSWLTESSWGVNNTRASGSRWSKSTAARKRKLEIEGLRAMGGGKRAQGRRARWDSARIKLVVVQKMSVKPKRYGESR
jgi:hypothetical protein